MRNPGRRGPKPSLTVRKARFVDAFFANGGNCYRAALTAGYSESKADSIASIRYDPWVVAEITKRAKKTADKADIKAVHVLTELGAILKSNVADYIEADLDGSMRFRPFATLTRHQLKAVSEITLETVTEGRGKKARPVTRMKLKFWDKNAAANTLCRHFGLFNEGDKGGATDRETIFHRAVSAVDRLIEGVIAEGEARLHAGLVPERPLLPVEVHPSET